MSDDKLSEEGLRKEIRNLLSWGHAHDYDDIIREARADAWDKGYRDCHSFNQGHIFEPHNPYRKQEEA
jgi:hypothetical protein